MNTFVIANRQKFSKFLLYGCCIALLMMGAACDSGNDSSTTSDGSIMESAGTTSVMFQVEWMESPDDSRSAKDCLEQDCYLEPTNCEKEGITKIKAAVYDGDKNIISDPKDADKDGYWDCSLCSGTLRIRSRNIPEGAKSIRGIVVFLAMDSENNVLYRGEKADIDIILGESKDAGTISVCPFVPTPEDELKDNERSIRWEAISGAERYEIQAIKEKSGETVMELKQIPDGSLSYNIPSGLWLDRRYQVRAVDRYGYTGKWSAENDPRVYFPDVNLEAAVRETINKLEEDIRLSDLEGLKELSLEVLNAAEREVKNLDGLQYCRELERLNLYCKDCGADPKQSDLDCSRNFSDISPLVKNVEFGGFGDGDEIDLRGNPLSETACKEQIPKLKEKGLTVKHDCLPEEFVGFYKIEYEGASNTGEFTLKINFNGKTVSEDYKCSSGFPLLTSPLFEFTGNTCPSGEMMFEHKIKGLGVEFHGKMDHRKIDDAGNISDITGEWWYEGELPNYGTFTGKKQ